MSLPRRAHGALLAIATAVACVFFAAVPAQAADPPTIDSGPADGAALQDPPTYTLSAGLLATIEWQLDGPSSPPSAQTGTGSPAVLTVDDPSGAVDGLYTFTAWAVDVLGPSDPVSRTYTLDNIPPGAPVLAAPENGEVINDATPTFTWTAATDPGGSGVASQSIVIDDEPTVLAATAPSFTPAPLDEGSHTWQVTAVDNAGNTSASPVWDVAIDLTSPAAPTVTQTPASPSAHDAPLGFGWTGGDADPIFGLGTYEWRVLSSGGQLAASGSVPATGASGQATVGALGTSDVYSFQVRQVDRAGNAGPFSLPVAFSVLPPPDPPPPGEGEPTAPPDPPPPGEGEPGAPPPGPASSSDPAPATSAPAQAATPARVRPATTNARRLRPRAGQALSGRRPILRWPRVASATIYNVQIFRMDGSRFVKVYSGFPRANRLRVPGGKLRFGERYVWRVWPFRGRSRQATRNPLGASFFDVRTLAQIRALRIVRPKGELVAGASSQVRWRPRSGTKQYRVRLLKDGERMFQAVTRRNRAVLPGRRLDETGTYQLLVQLGVGSPRARRFGGTWARVDIEVLTRAELAARRAAEQQPTG